VITDLPKICARCKGLSRRGNRLGLFTHAWGESFVHLDCWHDWSWNGIERALNGKCHFCGKPGMVDDPMGIHPEPGSVAGIVGHVRCILADLNAKGGDDGEG
jgi:hypothetical protein